MYALTRIHICITHCRHLQNIINEGLLSLKLTLGLLALPINNGKSVRVNNNVLLLGIVSW